MTGTDEGRGNMERAGWVACIAIRKSDSGSRWEVRCGTDSLSGERSGGGRIR